MKLDPAIQKVLALDPSKTAVSSHGGSGFTTTSIISTILENGSQKHFFMKTGSGHDKAVMFEGVSLRKRLSH